MHSMGWGRQERAGEWWAARASGVTCLQLRQHAHFCFGLGIASKATRHVLSGAGLQHCASQAVPAAARHPPLSTSVRFAACTASNSGARLSLLSKRSSTLPQVFSGSTGAGSGAGVGPPTNGLTGRSTTGQIHKSPDSPCGPTSAHPTGNHPRTYTP